MYMNCPCTNPKHHHVGGSCDQPADPQYGGVCLKCKTLNDSEEKEKIDLGDTSGNIPE
jgi:hypothetical protein